MKKFKELRKESLSFWLNSTGRTLLDHSECSSDTYENAFECNWQSYIDDLEENYHCPLTCWIGGWGSSITDILLSEQFDNIIIPNENEDVLGFLCRYIYRLMLVGEELLQALGDLSNILGEIREIRRINDCQIDRYHKYVNNIIKHRAHSCCYLGHHPVIEIDWQGKLGISESYPYSSQASRRPSVCSACLDDKATLPVPSPLSVLEVIVNAYNYCDLLIREKDLNKLIRYFKSDSNLEYS